MNISKTILAISVATALTASSSWAAIIFELNPKNVNAPAGSSSVAYNSQGLQLTASGFDNTGAVGTPHELFFKSEPPVNGASEHGLGLTGTTSNELQVNGAGTPANFIQLDLRSILAMGGTNGQVEVGSLQTGDSFLLFGSNTQGVLGAPLGGPFGSAFDDKFVSIPDFGKFKFVSFAAGSNDVLPIAFQVTPVPEMSALFPIIGLVAAIGGSQLLRRRRLAASLSR